MSITKKQLEELEEARSCGSRQEFHELLEEYTGIVAKPYTAYQYFDDADNYVGGDDDDVREMLRRTYCEVAE